MFIEEGPLNIRCEEERLPGLDADLYNVTPGGIGAVGDGPRKAQCRIAEAVAPVVRVENLSGDLLDARDEGCGPALLAGVDHPARMLEHHGLPRIYLGFLRFHVVIVVVGHHEDIRR